MGTGSADDLEAFAHLAHQLLLAGGNAHAQVPEVHRRLAALGKELLFFFADVMVDVLAEEICTLLTVHAALEEEIFYPAARAAGVDAGVLDEAEVEHASAKDLVAQIRDMEADAPLYDAKVRVLGEYIHHHVGEEEEGLFPKCRGSAMDLKDLGVRIAARKDELMGEMTEGLEVVG